MANNVNPEAEPNNQQEWESLLAVYAVGAMEPGAASEFERKLNECRSRVLLAEDYMRTTGMFGLAVPPAEPPEGHKDRFLARLATLPQEHPDVSVSGAGTSLAPGESSSVRDRTGPLALVTAPAEPATSKMSDLGAFRTRRGLAGVLPAVASVAAAIVILVGFWGWLNARNDLNSLQTQLDHSQSQIAELGADLDHSKALLAEAQKSLNIPADYVPFAVDGQTAQPDSSGVGFVNAKTNDFYIIAQGLDPLSPTQVYEMWWIPRDKSDPVPAGNLTIDSSGIASRRTKPPSALSTYSAIAVTKERAPGVEHPQGPIVLLGMYSMP